MPRLTIADLVRGTQGALASGRLEGVVTGVSIDSRTCGVGDVFFAIRGVRQDGHAFVGDAVGRGAGALVVSHLPTERALSGGLPLVLVEDTTQALQRLAAFHRRRHLLLVVAVTGSNGKTTTKELTALVLSPQFRVLKATGSFNNQWGVPLTLLALEPDHEALVLELGMNAFGEIAALAQLTQPSVGVVTTIAPAHLEGVGSIEGVQKAKAELVQAIPRDGLVVLNADDPLVMALAVEAQARVLTFGRSAQADVRLGEVTPTDAGIAFTVTIGRTTREVSLPLAGRHNASNAAAAIAVGLALGVPLEGAARALTHAAPLKGRLAWREAGRVRVLDDTYNANPASVRAALEALDAAGGGRAWVILGDMLELGAVTESAHREAGAQVAVLPAAGLATVGSAARAAAAAAQAAGCADARAFDSPEEAAEYVAARLAPGDRVLVKGSRGMRMERAVGALLERLGGDAAC